MKIAFALLLVPLSFGLCAEDSGPFTGRVSADLKVTGEPSTTVPFTLQVQQLGGKRLDTFGWFHPILMDPDGGMMHGYVDFPPGHGGSHPGHYTLSWNTMTLAQAPDDAHMAKRLASLPDRDCWLASDRQTLIDEGSLCDFTTWTTCPLVGFHAKETHGTVVQSRKLLRNGYRTDHAFVLLEEATTSLSGTVTKSASIERLSIPEGVSTRSPVSLEGWRPLFDSTAGDGKTLVLALNSGTDQYRIVDAETGATRKLVSPEFFAPSSLGNVPYTYLPTNAAALVLKNTVPHARNVLAGLGKDGAVIFRKPIENSSIFAIYNLSADSDPVFYTYPGEWKFIGFSDDGSRIILECLIRENDGNFVQHGGVLTVVASRRDGAILLALFSLRSERTITHLSVLRDSCFVISQRGQTVYPEQFPVPGESAAATPTVP